MQEVYLKIRARAEKLVSTIVPEKKEKPLEVPHEVPTYVMGATTHKAMLASDEASRLLTNFSTVAKVNALQKIIESRINKERVFVVDGKTAANALQSQLLVRTVLDELMKESASRELNDKLKEKILNFYARTYAWNEATVSGGAVRERLSGRSLFNDNPKAKAAAEELDRKIDELIKTSQGQADVEAYEMFQPGHLIKHTLTGLKRVLQVLQAQKYD